MRHQHPNYVSSRTFQAALYVIIVVIVTITGCTNETRQRLFLSVGTAPPGGAFFVVGGAIAQVVADHSVEKGWQVTAEATKGSQENIRRLDRGELDFALANSAITFFALKGHGSWKKRYSMRAVMTLAANVALFVTPQKSNIMSIADLKGHRVVVGPAGAGFEFFLRPILTAHGISYKDFTPLHSSQTGAVELLADGTAAAAFLGGAIPTASITRAVASQDIRFVSYEEDAKEHLLTTYPFFDTARIPAATYKGQTEVFNGINVGSMHLITAASVNAETVYHFVNTLYKHREEVVTRHPAGKAINRANAARNTGTPFHPGAVRFYREIGIWTE